MPSAVSKQKQVRKRKTAKAVKVPKPRSGSTDRRVNISQNELKYQKLYERHQKLLVRHRKYKQTHERKVALLRNQLKHTLKFVGVKLQSLETRLLWYQKQWKNQQTQYTKSKRDSPFTQNQRNKCIQTGTGFTSEESTRSIPVHVPSLQMHHVIPSKTPLIRQIPKSKKIKKGNRGSAARKAMKVVIKDTSSSLISSNVLDSDTPNSTNSMNAVISTPSSSNSKYQIVIPTPPIVHDHHFEDFKHSMKSIESKDTINTASNVITVPLSTESTPNSLNRSKGFDLSFLSHSKAMRSPNMLSNDTLQYLPDDAMAKHNQLITRLRARLDTMSDILITTKDKLHREFDDVSMPPSVDLSNIDLSRISHVDMRKVYDDSSEFMCNGKIKSTSCAPLPETECVTPTVPDVNTVSPSPMTESVPVPALNTEFVSSLSVSGISSPLTEELLESDVIGKIDLAVDTGEKDKDLESTYSFLADYDDDASDFKSVISRVTENMAKLGRNLKTMSSISSPCSDSETDPVVSVD